MKIERNDKDFTTNVVNRYLDIKQGKVNSEGAKWPSTFTRFTNTYLGKNCDTDTIVDFWHSVVFYNFLEITLSGLRVKYASTQDYEDSKSAFLAVLEYHLPDFVIVWGNDFSHQLRRLFKTETNESKCGEIIDSDVNGDVFYINANNRFVPTYRTVHPSSAMPREIWHKNISKFINHISAEIQ